MSLENALAQSVGDIPRTVIDGVRLGVGLADGYDIFDSPIGQVAVAFNLEGVSAVDTADDQVEDRFRARFGRELVRGEAPRAWGHRIRPAIEAGRPGGLPVDLRSVTAFQADVLGAAATIPRGEVRPYAWVASQVNRPGAARAVGSTMAANPVPLIIPCHRVVRSDGKLGEYSLGGSENKWSLLSHEGAGPARLEALAASGTRIQGNRSTHICCHPSCHAVRRSKPSNVVDFHSLDEAISAGYRPCKLCKPA